MNETYTLNQIHDLSVLLAQSCDKVRSIARDAENGDISPKNATAQIYLVIDKIENFIP